MRDALSLRFLVLPGSRIQDMEKPVLRVEGKSECRKYEMSSRDQVVNGGESWREVELIGNRE